MSNRTLGLLLLLISITGAITGGIFMARRAAAYNKTLPEPFLFEPTLMRNFVCRGKPVAITDTTIEQAGEQHAALRVTYGDAAAVIPVLKPSAANFKDLSAYGESFRVLSFAPIKEGKAQITDFKDDNWRAILVARHVAEGWPEETWGEVRVKDWTFDIYELMPDGTINGPRTVQYPDRRGRVPMEVYARTDLQRAGKPVPPFPPSGPRLTAVDLIAERSWEWQAALFCVPKAQVARYRFKGDAVSAMGWTLPVTGLSVLGGMAGIALVMSARAGRRS